MLPFQNETTKTETNNLYNWSLRELCKTFHLYETTKGPFRIKAAELRNKALIEHNKHRVTLGKLPLTLHDFQIGNKVIYKHN